MSKFIKEEQSFFSYKKLKPSQYFQTVQNYFFLSLFSALFPKSWRQPSESDESKIRRAVSSPVSSEFRMWVRS